MVDTEMAALSFSVRLYVGAMIVCAVAALVVAAIFGTSVSADRLWLVAVLAALTALENVLAVRLQKGSEGESRAHEEALLVFIILLLPPVAGLVTFFVGVVVGQLVAPRERVKVVFNIAQFTTSAALAFALEAVLAPSDELGMSRVLAALLGVLVFSLANRAAVAGVIALTGASTFREDFLDDLRPAAVTWAGAVSVGLLAGVAAIAHPWTLPFALAAWIALTAALSGHARARHDRQAIGGLVESAAAAIFSVDHRGHVREWNPEIARITGRSAVSVKGARLADVVRMWNGGEAPIDLLSPSAFEGRRRRRFVRLEITGAERWLTLSRASLPDGGFAFVAQDVTEQREAERAVRDSEERLRMALDAGAMGWWDWDMASGQVRWSENLERIFGLAQGTFAGTFEDFIARVHPDDRDFVELTIERGLAEGRHELIHRIVWPDGTVRWLEGKGRVLEDAAAGSPCGMSGIAFDVTERKEAEEKLNEATRRYRSLVEHLPLTTYIDAIDATSSNIYSSPQIEPVLGYSVEEWRSDADLFPKVLHPDDRERVLAEHAHTHASGEPLRTEYRLIARDGRVVWIHDEAVIVEDEQGNPLYLQGYLLDLTERKKLESDLLQAQKMDAIGQLAGGVAHDFNNMMSAVVGFSELVLHRLEPGHPVRDQIEEIRRAGERASEMTHQLLAFSRKQVLQPRVLDLNAVVAETEKLLRRLIGEDVDLVSVLDPELAPVEADSGQLQQVVMNLAVNARDAMALGGKLTIETENVELDEEYAARHLDVEPGRYVLLAVSDTGVGMDAATKARIFEPFFTTKGTGEGTGLGLATVYGIVKQSGGEIGVYSEPGRGTTFKIYLPQAAVGGHRLETELAREQPPPGSEAILLVEDEELVRKLGRQALEERGYTVLEASSGDHALEVAREHEGGIDLLVTDVVMPGLSGRELAEQLAPLRPEMKILFTSGYTDDAIVRHGVLEPGIAFLPKPLTPTSLAHKVREVLDSPNGQGRAPTTDARSGARAISR